MAKRALPPACSLLLLAAFACGDGGSGSSPFDSAGSTGGASAGSMGTGGGATGGATGASTASGGGASTGGASDGGGTGPKFDVGGGATAGGDGGPDSGCTAVDVLFVVDNSASMTTYQQALTAAFPTFVGAMVANLPPGTDLHVGVTTSSFCDPGNNPGHAETNCVAAEDNATIQSAFITPDQGTVSGNGYQGRLVSYQGQTFGAADTSDATAIAALSEWFGGAAAVGSNGCSFEFNAAGAGYAFHPTNDMANSGFLRDEGAVLLIFVLSDEADQSGDVADLGALHDMVTAAKAGCGGDTCIITGGLLSEWCTPNQSATYTFLSSFGEDPVWDSIGSPFGPPPDYTQVVGDALAQVVAQTCDQIPPVG